MKKFEGSCFNQVFAKNTRPGIDWIIIPKLFNTEPRIEPYNNVAFELSQATMTLRRYSWTNAPCVRIVKVTIGTYEGLEPFHENGEWNQIVIERVDFEQKYVLLALISSENYPMYVLKNEFIPRKY